MPNESTKLDDKMHAILVKAFEEGFPKVRACKMAGIHRNTLDLWMQKGEAAKSGKHRELYLAIEEARATFWEVKQSELEQVVYKQALKGDTTISMKLLRVMKLSTEDSMFIEEAIENSDALKERFEEEGILYKQEVTIRQHRPNGHLALEILARRAPEEWGSYETLKLEMDIHKELKELGIEPEDADEVVAAAVQALDQLVEKKGKSSEE